MKIIEKKYKNHKEVTISCGRCESIFSFEKEDIKTKENIINYQRNEKEVKHYIECPVCNAHNNVENIINDTKYFYDIKQ